MENKINKKQIMTLTIGIIALLVLILGATYAYFQVNASNNFGTTTIEGTADALGSVALNGTSAQLRLHLTGPDMMQGDDDITYWATSDGTPSTTQNIVTVGSTQVTGAGYFNCNYTLNVTATATNSMYTAFQGMSGKSSEQIVLKIGNTKYDFNTENLFPITINGTLEGLTSENSESLTAEFYIVNKDDVNQSALAGTDISISVNATSFSCRVTTPPPSVAESLIELAENDSTIVKYTGKVTDTVEQIGEGVDATNVYAFTSNTNNNLVFANHCWQIRRTTENGGIKIQYNGEPTLGTSDGKTTYDCGTTRPYHMSSVKTTQSLLGTYLYGTGYTASVSGDTTTYTLTGTQSVSLDSTNAETVIPQIAAIYPYTCRNTTGTCTNASLYKVDSQSSSYRAYVYTTTYRDSIASAAYNTDSKSPSNVGYMYTSAYAAPLMRMTDNQSIVNSSTYVIGDGISDNGDGTFTLTGTVNAVSGSSWSTDYANYVNKYVCMPGYYDNSSGIYTCSDNGAQDVGALRYITATTSTNFRGARIYKYGYGIELIGNSYSLTAKSGEPQTLQYISNWENNSASNCFTDNNTKISTCGYATLSKSHYTCYNLSGICNTYYYVYWSNSISSMGVPISAGKYVSTNLLDSNNVLYELLNKSDINSTSSSIKELIDSWYQGKLFDTSYEKLIDMNTIFCNDRRISSFGGWNPDGGSTHTNSQLKFTEFNLTSNLGCERPLDAFSVYNNSAHLSYPIGLMSGPEMNILGNNTVTSSIASYWLSSPYSLDIAGAYVLRVAGPITADSIGQNRSVRPAISLNSKAEIASGTGSTTDPFIVKGSEMTP